MVRGGGEIRVPEIVFTLSEAVWLMATSWWRRKHRCDRKRRPSIICGGVAAEIGRMRRNVVERVNSSAAFNQLGALASFGLGG